MIVRYRIFALIHILCYAATIHGFLLDANDAETCNLLCVQCNATAVFADDRCECNFADDSDKVSGAECIERIQREIQAIELNMLSENPTDEERNVRSLLKYRRRLRPGDAEKVALYFISGGPAAGHSHFVRAFKEAYDSADSAANSFSGVIDESNPEDGFHGVSLTGPVSSNTYESPLVSEYASYGSPTMQGAEMYPPILRAMNPAITYPTSGLYDPTTSLSPVTHPHRLPLHHALARAITFPGNVLHHVLHPRIFHRDQHIVRSTNFPQDTSDTAKVNQCEDNEDFTSSSFPTARNNANKPTEQNGFGYTAPSQYPYLTHALYQPMQYQYLPYQYTSYYSPLMNVLHPVANVVQPVPHYMQDMSNPLTSAPNPHCTCDNNANTEQKSGVLTTDKTIYSNNGIEKSDDATRRDIFKEEKKPEKNGISKS